MLNKEDMMEWVEDYAEGRLTAAESKAFEVRLVMDPELQEALRVHRATQRALLDVFEEERARGIIAELERKRGRTAWSITLRWAAAAAVLMTIGFTGWYFFLSVPKPQELAERYAIKEAPLPVLMDDRVHTELDKAMQAYGNGAYEHALEELDQLPASDTVLFYQGLCAAQLAMDATPFFRSVAEQRSSAYRPKALYHLLIISLEQADMVNSADLLREQLSMPEHPYHEALQAIARSGVVQP